MCRFGVPLRAVAEPLDGPWASAVRAIAERAGIVVVAGMFVPADDGRVTNTLIATGPGVDTHYDKIHLYDAFGFAESKTVAPGSRTRVDQRRRRRGRADHCATTSGSPSSTSSWPSAAPSCSRCTPRGAPGRASSSSGRCWPAPARIDTTGSSPRSARPIRATRSPPPDPPASAAAWSRRPYGEVQASAGADPQLLISDIDLDAAQKARETIAVLHNRSEFATPVRQNRAGDRSLGSPGQPGPTRPAAVTVPSGPPAATVPTGPAAGPRWVPSARRAGRTSEQGLVAAGEDQEPVPRSAVDRPGRRHRHRAGGGAACWRASCTPAAARTRWSPRRPGAWWRTKPACRSAHFRRS